MEKNSKRAPRDGGRDGGKREPRSEMDDMMMGDDDRDGGGKGDGTRRRKSRPPLDLILDYKDIESLRPFLSDGGRIVPAHMSRLNRQQQNRLKSEIKRARHLAMLPISDRHAK